MKVIQGEGTFPAQQGPPHFDFNLKRLKADEQTPRKPYFGSCYSAFSTSTGFTDAARLAGITVATTVTVKRRAATPTRMM